MNSSCSRKVLTVQARAAVLRPGWGIPLAIIILGRRAPAHRHPLSQRWHLGLCSTLAMRGGAGLPAWCGSWLGYPLIILHGFGNQHPRKLRRDTEGGGLLRMLGRADARARHQRRPLLPAVARGSWGALGRSRPGSRCPLPRVQLKRKVCQAALRCRMSPSALPVAWGIQHCSTLLDLSCSACSSRGSGQRPGSRTAQLPRVMMPLPQAHLPAIRRGWFAKNAVLLLCAFSRVLQGVVHLPWGWASGGLGRCS
jgi:hypothetical protein